MATKKLLLKAKPLINGLFINCATNKLISVSSKARNRNSLLIKVNIGLRPSFALFINSLLINGLFSIYPLRG
jgi:hypothetical protein